MLLRDLKNDMKGDIRRIETIVEDTETKVKEDPKRINRDICNDASKYKTRYERT